MVHNRCVIHFCLFYLFYSFQLNNNNKNSSLKNVKLRLTHAFKMLNTMWITMWWILAQNIFVSCFLYLSIYMPFSIPFSPLIFKCTQCGWKNERKADMVEYVIRFKQNMPHIIAVKCCQALNAHLIFFLLVRASHMCFNLKSFERKCIKSWMVKEKLSTGHIPENGLTFIIYCDLILL